ncbi:MAG: serine/threonine-protein kinase [Longimicrobiales bacterium]
MPTMSKARVDRSRVEALFLAALELEPEARGAFLAERCAGDESLRAEVESLLESWDAPGLVPELGEERPFGGRYPERIGSYRVVRPLGEGGMGTVLLAIREGPGFEQTVALKLIRGSFVDPLLARRFEEERRILALLEHPGIARLVDGGLTPDGQPYYAMEFVQGDDILAWSDTRELGLEDRIRLFIKVCDAVHHAHQQLVVHRDLKPSNILVTPAGLPKLLDFGIAKNLEAVVPSEQTAPWVTPAYASPEQVAGGVVTTRSDVYALGVLLCELLSGSRPYETRGRSPVELARIITGSTPRKPSELVTLAPDGDTVARARRTTPARLSRGLRGELDLVVLKALAKEPERRYDSARDLAEDLERFLEGRPLEARADSLPYRLRKFVGRHRGLVAAAALVVLVLVGGVAGIVWQAARTAEERDRATLEAGRARQVTALMTDIFRLGDPTQALGDTIGVRQVLGEGARRVDESLDADPVLQATLFLELARIYRNLGLLDEAGRLGDRVEGLRSVHEPGTLAYADVLGFQGLVSRDAGRSGRAIERLERAVALRDSLLPEPDTSTATLLVGLGWEVRSAGDHARAASLFSRALDIQEARLGSEHPAVGTTMLGLAAAFHDQGSFDQAEALFRRALSPGRAEATPVAATALVNLGMVQRIRERFQEAEPLLRSGLAMRMRLFDEEHPDVLEARQELAVALVMLGRYDEAGPLLVRNLDVGLRRFGDDHEATRSARESLGVLEHERGRHDAAVRYLEASMASKMRVRGADHPGVVFSLISLGDVLVDAGRLDEADRRYLEALAMGERLGGTEGVYGALSRLGRARVALRRGRIEPADSLARAAASLAGDALRPGHRYLLDIDRTRAEILLARGRAAEARALLATVLEAEAAARPGPHPRQGRTLVLLGRARAAVGDTVGAQAAWQEAGTHFARLPAEHPDRRAVARLSTRPAGP